MAPGFVAALSVEEDESYGKKVTSGEWREGNVCGIVASGTGVAKVLRDKGLGRGVRAT